MRDNPSAATGLAIVLTAAIIGGAYYLLVMRQPAPIPPVLSPQAPTTWQTLTPRPKQAIGQTSDKAKSVPDVSAETSPGKQTSPRTDTPIKCFDPEVGEFWTNAATCAGADLNNRLSYVPAQTPTPNAGADSKKDSPAKVKADRDKYMGMDYMTPEEKAVKSRSDDDN